MADVQLVHLRNAGDGHDIVIVQAVPRVQVHSQIADELAGGRQRDELLMLRRAARQSVLARVQFDRVGAELLGQLDLPRIGIEKQADAKFRPPAVARSPWPSPPRCATTSSPPSVVTSSRRSGTIVAWSGFTWQAMPTISSATDSSRLSLIATVSRKQPHIAVLNVPPVFAEVNRDRIRPAQLRQRRRRHRIGLIRLAGLPKRRHVIDVDAKFGHGFESDGTELSRGRLDTKSHPLVHSIE